MSSDLWKEFGGDQQSPGLSINRFSGVNDAETGTWSDMRIGNVSSQGKNDHDTPRVPSDTAAIDDVVDDDFGEFEDAKDERSQTSAGMIDWAQPTPNAFGENNDSSPARRLTRDMKQDAQQSAWQSSITEDWDRFPRNTNSAGQSTLVPGGISKARADALRTSKVLSSEIEDTDWGDFIAPVSRPIPISYIDESSTSRISTKENSVSVRAPNEAHKMAVSSLPLNAEKPQSTSSSDFDPPSNIPPPSILLTLFPPLLKDLPLVIETLFSNLGDSADSCFVNPATTIGLQVRLSIVTVAARVLAGRKYRWRRDPHLAQSMKIGPSHGGKLGGMKLTGIDRVEKLREDRESAELIRLWRQNAGKLRSALTIANSRLGSSFSVSEISESFRVHLATSSQGALSSAGGCLLCGLKREERIDRIDVNVEDTFGEWWTDYFGHSECQIFWNEHKELLKSK